MDMKQWNQLVKDAQNRRMSTWRLGEIAAVVKDADGMWSVQVNTLIKEITEKDDTLTAIIADRDALASDYARAAEYALRLEEKNTTQERIIDALQARFDALTAALAPAIEMDDDPETTPAPWGEFCESGEWWIEQAGSDGGPADLSNPKIVCADSGADVWPHQEDIELTLALRNALPAVRKALENAP